MGCKESHDASAVLFCRNSVSFIKIECFLYMSSTNKEIWVFLSHSHEDYNRVRKVRDILENQDLRPLMFFLKCLNDDDEINDLIKREIDARTRFIYCKSNKAEHSKWVQKELAYIQQNRRSYDVIDLSLSDEELSAQLKNYANSLHVYFNYSNQFKEQIRQVSDIINKYDCYIHNSELYVTSCDRGKRQQNVYGEIDPSIQRGCFICVIDKFLGDFFLEKLNYALENKSKDSIIIMFLMDDYVVNHFENIRSNNKVNNEETSYYRVYNLTESQDIINDMADYILKSIIASGDFLTYAVDFQQGRNRSKDNTEQQRAFDLFKERAERDFEYGHSYAALALARAYANGAGIEVNLEKAFFWYKEFITDLVSSRDDSQIIEEMRKVQILLDARDGTNRWQKQLEYVLKWVNDNK